MLRGLAESKSDGIIQIFTGAARLEGYAPRSYLALAEVVMANRAKHAVSDLRGAGTTMFSS